MRRSISIFAGALLTGILFFIISCSKEETKSNKQNQPAQTQYEQQVTRAIKTFKEKVAYYRENPGYKSGETVSADSALWLLEATINYSHAFPNDFYEEMLTEDLTLVVPKDENGAVDMSVLTQKYTEMKEDITALYYNSSFENKGLVLVDLSEASQTGDEIILNVETVTGDRGGGPPPPVGDGPFEEGDDWWYGELLGHCNPHTPNSTDAAKELYTTMNNYILSQNINVSFPNVTSRTITGGDLNAFDRLFSTYDYNGVPFDEYDELCLDWQEMNAHFNDMKYLLYTKLPDENVIPVGYIPVELTYHLGFYEAFGDDIHYYHKFTFKFGFPIYRDDDGPEEL